MYTIKVNVNGGGGGGQKGGNFRGGGGGRGVSYREFFPWAPSKIAELLKTGSCSVEQAISCFTVNSLLKQRLLFSSSIFYLRMLFFTAYEIDSCHRLENKLPVI